MAVGMAVRTILIVDDDRNICNLIELVLADAGYMVKKAGNGRQALAMIDEERPDLVLLDLMMPGISGWEVCSWLKADPSRADIPVVVLTADRSAKVGCQKLGILDYIAKPFDLESLKAVVEKHLPGRLGDPAI